MGCSNNMSGNETKIFDTFICHSSEDKAIADAACAVLERNLVRCWIAPRDVTPGKKWGDEIASAIERSKVLLVIFSSNANASDHVREEVTCAISTGLSVLTFRIQAVKPNGALHLHLGNKQWLDAATPPVEKHLERLASAIKVLIGNDTAQVSTVEDTSRQEPQNPNAPRPHSVYLLLGFGTLVAVGILLFGNLNSASKSSQHATQKNQTSPTDTTEPKPSNAKPSSSDDADVVIPKSSVVGTEIGRENDDQADSPDELSQRPDEDNPNPTNGQAPSRISRPGRKIEKGIRVRIRSGENVDYFQYDSRHSSDQSRSKVPANSTGVVTEASPNRLKCKVKWDDSSIPELWNPIDNLVAE